MSTAETATAVGISFRDLLAYTHSEALKWKDWFARNPAALDVAVGGEIGTVRELVKHIFQSELWFAARLSGQELDQSAFEPKDNDGLWALHGRAYESLARFVATAQETDMERVITLPFRDGFDVTVRKLLAQAALHSVHHWAQIAMEVRQAGMPSDGSHDILLSNVL